MRAQVSRVTRHCQLPSKHRCGQVHPDACSAPMRAAFCQTGTVPLPRGTHVARRKHCPHFSFSPKCVNPNGLTKYLASRQTRQAGGPPPRTNRITPGAMRGCARFFKDGTGGKGKRPGHYSGLLMRTKRSKNRFHRMPRRRLTLTSHTEHCAFASQRRKQSTKCPVHFQSPVLVTNRLGTIYIPNALFNMSNNHNNLWKTLEFGDFGRKTYRKQAAKVTIAIGLRTKLIAAGHRA